MLCIEPEGLKNVFLEAIDVHIYPYCTSSYQPEKGGVPSNVSPSSSYLPLQLPESLADLVNVDQQAWFSGLLMLKLSDVHPGRQTEANSHWTVQPDFREVGEEDRKRKGLH